MAPRRTPPPHLCSAGCLKAQALRLSARGILSARLTLQADQIILRRVQVLRAPAAPAAAAAPDAAATPTPPTAARVFKLGTIVDFDRSSMCHQILFGEA